ncbi:MAG: hypothetical protein JJV93_03100 [Alphaproteobacteria bacterium]|nr:hypothetical protein [Alphaproteobacteria bacterium]MBL0718215.1 hypothetical protein [Alphaproteobacteria bacterium]
MKLKIIPKSFLGRTLSLIIFPLIITQTILVSIFLNTHWDAVQRSMSRSFMGDIRILLYNIENNNRDFKDLKEESSRYLGINIRQSSTPPIRPEESREDSRLTNFIKELDYSMKYPNKVFIDEESKLIFIDIILEDDRVITIATSLKRIYSSTTRIFLLWIFGSALIAFLLSVPFLTSHKNSLRKLYKLVVSLMYNKTVKKFHPSGSIETITIGRALILLNERMQLNQRKELEKTIILKEEIKSLIQKLHKKYDENTLIKLESLLEKFVSIPDDNTEIKNINITTVIKTEILNLSKGIQKSIIFNDLGSKDIVVYGEIIDYRFIIKNILDFYSKNSLDIRVSDNRIIFSTQNAKCSQREFKNLKDTIKDITELYDIKLNYIISKGEIVLTLN